MGLDSLPPEKAIDRNTVNKGVLESIKRNFNQFQFNRDQLKAEDDEAEQQVDAFMNLCKQSVQFINMLIDQSNRVEFISECESERRVLMLAKELANEHLLIWEIPTV